MSNFNTTKYNVRPALLVSLWLLSATGMAATPIDQTRSLDPTGRIDIENLKGRIQVRAWDRAEVKISGTLGEGVERLIVEGDGQKLTVKAQYPKNNGWGGAKTGPTDLLLIDLGEGRNRLGGSALAQVFNATGSDAPDVDAPQKLAAFFKIIQKLLNHILNNFDIQPSVFVAVRIFILVLL